MSNKRKIIYIYSGITIAAATDCSNNTVCLFLRTERRGNQKEVARTKYYVVTYIYIYIYIHKRWYLPIIMLLYNLV